MRKASLIILALTLLVTLVLGHDDLHTQDQQLDDLHVQERQFEDELISAADQMLSRSDNDRILTCIEKSNKKRNCTERGGTCRASCKEQKTRRLCKGGCSCCLPCKDKKRCMNNGGKCQAKNMFCAGEKADAYCKGGCTCCLPVATDIECKNKVGFCAAKTGDYCKGEVSHLQNSCKDVCSCCVPDVCAADQFVLGTECFKAFEYNVVWNHARNICLSDGGDLAQPQDADALRDYLGKMYGNYPNAYWLGGKFENAIASFLSGEVFTDYQNIAYDGDCMYMYVYYGDYKYDISLNSCSGYMLPLCEYKTATSFRTPTDSANVCGGEYNSTSGILRHPMSGGNYTDNEHCTWIIRADVSINMTFVQFDTEEDYDELIIRNGESIDSDLLGEYSGHNNPWSIHTMSSTNAAYLRFTSDYSITHSGFELHWEPLDGPYCPVEWVHADQDIVCAKKDRVTWQEAFDYCSYYGLNMAQPKDMINLLLKLKEIDGGANYAYWIGGKGSGSQQLWLNGTTIDSSLSEWINTPNTATTDCSYIQYYANKQVLNTKSCKYTTFILCSTD